MVRSRVNELWGHYGEGVARFLFNLETDRANFHDAVDSHGNPWEIKLCARRVGARGDYGKWFIRWENHQKLREAGGYYALGVYDPAMWKHGPVLAMEYRPATWLDEVSTYKWTDNGSRRGETVIRPPWTVLFEPEDIPGEGVASADALTSEG